MKPEVDSAEPPIIPILANSADLHLHVNGERKTVVLFEMTACPYCRMFEERFLELARSRTRDFAYLRVNLDDPGDPLWHQFGIRAVPTVIVFAKGQVDSRLDSVLFLGITKRHWSEFSARI